MDVRGDIDQNAPGFLVALRRAMAITRISASAGGPAAAP
jgi:hypothetical protein